MTAEEICPVMVATPRLLPECDSALEKLWDYFDRELPTREAEHVHNHLIGCPRCRPHVRFERRFLRALAESRPGPIDSASILEHLRRAMADDSRGAIDD
jgi:Putative zinc-finger